MQSLRPTGARTSALGVPGLLGADLEGHVLLAACPALAAAEFERTTTFNDPAASKHFLRPQIE